jgi:hypothetical protein
LAHKETNFVHPQRPQHSNDLQLIQPIASSYVTDTASTSKVTTAEGAHAATTSSGVNATAYAPTEPPFASLRIINVTDTYKLDNFASLKTLITEKTSEAAKNGFATKSIMIGDFLAPCLLSAYDEDEGMMKMLNACPIA